ncbi:hypothetical protein CLF_104510 [Clonorchis sinensis]|uniref:Reverse transcriptase domain-containing protein n=1 Tax=Clonorchis sinensis TaxID=79923 RepID=G7YBS6_CLOSI|nr:hypothetical protein CLF_104510 [Clonorchis sinensis]
MVEIIPKIVVKMDRLQTQAAKCDYGAQLEDQLRDRLIAGMQLPDLQQKLLLCPDQKFQTIRKICEQYEDVKHAAKTDEAVLLNYSKRNNSRMHPDNKFKPRTNFRAPNPSALSTSGPSIIGLKVLHSPRTGIISLTSVNVNDLKRLIPKCSEATSGMQIPKVKLEDTGDPVFLKTRANPFGLREPVRRTLNPMCEEGILTPIESSNRATPIVTPLKADSITLRICGDYRLTLNTRLLQTVFKQVMNTIKKDLEGVETYQDDVIVHAADQSTHAMCLLSLPNRFSEFIVASPPYKCTFDVLTFTCLGYIVDGSGCKPDKNRLLPLGLLRPATRIILLSNGKRMVTILDLNDLSSHRRRIDQVEFNIRDDLMVSEQNVIPEEHTTNKEPEGANLRRSKQLRARSQLNYKHPRAHSRDCEQTCRFNPLIVTKYKFMSWMHFALWEAGGGISKLKGEERCASCHRQHKSRVFEIVGRKQAVTFLQIGVTITFLQAVDFVEHPTKHQRHRGGLDRRKIVRNQRIRVASRSKRNIRTDLSHSEVKAAVLFGAECIVLLRLNSESILSKNLHEEIAKPIRGYRSDSLDYCSGGKRCLVGIAMYFWLRLHTSGDAEAAAAEYVGRSKSSYIVVVSGDTNAQRNSQEPKWLPDTQQSSAFGPLGTVLRTAIQLTSCYLRSRILTFSRNLERKRWKAFQTPVFKSFPVRTLPGVAYSDDITFIFEGRSEPQALLNRLTIPSSCIRFAPSKCKVMLQNVQSLDIPLTVQVESPELVENLTYIGGCLNSDRSMSDEVTAGFSKARIAFPNVRHLWRRKGIPPGRHTTVGCTRLR